MNFDIWKLNWQLSCEIGVELVKWYLWLLMSDSGHIGTNNLYRGEKLSLELRVPSIIQIFSYSLCKLLGQSKRVLNSNLTKS